MAQIDKFPYGLVKVQRAATLNIEDSWMYEDGPDEIVFTVDQACQLLGVGLCGTEGGLTVELEVYEVEQDDFSRAICTLHTAAQSFTKADGHILKLFLSSPIVLQPDKYYMLRWVLLPCYLHGVHQFGLGEGGRGRWQGDTFC